MNWSVFSIKEFSIRKKKTIDYQLFVISIFFRKETGDKYYNLGDYDDALKFTLLVEEMIDDSKN